jgi:exonuclease SbcC
MQLKSIKLENIRSYKFQEIEFPSGSLLLSGDIGSGKSTILLAIEFALFGTKKVMLTGGALLRNGSNTGAVELRFEVDGKDIIVKRGLKKSKGAVEQTNGYLIVDEMKKDLTPQELKAQILSILGYPSELVAKSKEMVYRYTVYTPQEEMRQILFEEEEERVDTLRKVFGIDKYKKIRENALIAVRSLKEKRKEIEAAIFDLDYKKKQKAENEEELRQIDEKVKLILPKLEEAKKAVEHKKEFAFRFEKDINEFHKLKRELEVKEANLFHKTEQMQRNSKNIDLLSKQISSLKQEIDGKETKDFKKELFAKQQLIMNEEKKLRELSNNISQVKAKVEHFRELKNKIVQLDQCPTCEQKVEESHKKKISEREDVKISQLESEMKVFGSKYIEVEKGIESLREDVESLRKLDSGMMLVLFKKRNIDEKEALVKELDETNERLKKETFELNAEKTELSKNLSLYHGIEEKYKAARNELDGSAREERRIEIEKTSYETERKGILNLISVIEKDIVLKEAKKKGITYISEMQNWIENSFINLMTVMEKHVMMSVYAEFNEMFQKWFKLLVEDETINVRVDDRFTPVIDQNGFETDISYLSGGEKTAAALAYRLALNKVVNDLMSGIKTKDLIILDEPTDGFSSEQLDRVRDVLLEIGTKQTILVSHESKIESFVDNVIKIVKNEHVSEVTGG